MNIDKLRQCRSQRGNYSIHKVSGSGISNAYAVDLNIRDGITDITQVDRQAVMIVEHSADILRRYSLSNYIASA